MSTPGQDERDCLSQKRRREGTVKLKTLQSDFLKQNLVLSGQCYVSLKCHCHISTMLVVKS